MIKSLTFLLIAKIIISFAQPVTYPLQIGSKWQFLLTTLNKDSTHIHKEVIGDTLMPNGKKYATILNESPYNYKYHSFQRYINDSVFEYDKNFKAEFLFYRFNLKMDDTVSTFIKDEDTTDVRLDLFQTTQVFGINHRVWYFSFNHRQGIGEKESRAVADGIGEIRNGSLGYIQNIEGAIINGIQFGTITKVQYQKIFQPHNLVLLQNYPNPFNPTTTIEYSIPSKSFITLKIFDLLGKTVAMLVNQKREAGSYSVKFNGNSIPSGVYICQLQAENLFSVKKLLLLK